MHKKNISSKMHINIAGLLLFTTVLSVVTPSTTALADSNPVIMESSSSTLTESNANVAASTSENQNNSLASASSSVSSASQNPSSSSASDSSNVATNTEMSSVGSTDSQSNVGATTQLSIQYQVNGNTIETIQTDVRLNAQINLRDYLPSDFQNKYVLAGNVDGYTVTKDNETVVVPLIEFSEKTSDADQESDSLLIINNQGIDIDWNIELNDEENANKVEEPSNKQAEKIQKDLNKAIPVLLQDSTPLPSKKEVANRKEVVNPMLRPQGNTINSSKDFKTEVPMTKEDEPTRDLKDVKLYKDFDASVLRWKPYLDKVTKHYDMEEYRMLLLAIMQVETKGQGKDVMQSSESAGLKPNSLNAAESIEQATRYLKAIVEKAEAMDKAEKENKSIDKDDYHHYAKNKRLLAQTYAFGGNFLDYISKSKDGYTLKTTERYSKEVLAPLLGNEDAKTYRYVNPISKMYNKTYLYTNGGNFFYGDLVSQYMVDGFMRKILNELIDYAGQPYVFGGKSPETGFDCSGLVAYGFKQVGLDFPSYTVTEWEVTEPVKSIKDAKPGDLIFFKGTYNGPNFISHVGFLIDEYTMFDSNSSGVGFHSINDDYWQKHFAGIRRVKQADDLNKKAKADFNSKVQDAVRDYQK